MARLIAIGLLAGKASSGAQLSPQELRGKEIYRQGTSPSGGPILALMGASGAQTPGKALPCSRCHGANGVAPEDGGGLGVAEITWTALTQPSDMRPQSGRKFPAYTVETLKRAIAMGIDPAGNPLHSTMPRYRMSHEDEADLVAYMQKLGSERDPGITDESLTIGTLLPPPGRKDTLAAAIRSVLEAFIEDLNAGGGVQGRQIRLHCLGLPEATNEWRDAVEDFLTEKQVFALVGAFIAGGDQELAALVHKKGVPLVGPFSLQPQIDPPLNRQVFYLYSGLGSQGRALAEFMDQQDWEEKPGVAILYPEEPELQRAAEAIDSQLEYRGWTERWSHSYRRDSFDALKTVRDLSERSVGVVFYLDRGERLARFVVAAEQLGWHPHLLALGSQVAAHVFEISRSFPSRIFLSFPTLPFDQQPAGLAAYQKLAEKANLPREAKATQISTLASAQVLVAGLKRAGRELSRETLIEALEGLYEFPTHLTPLLSYGPSRRVGALGAYVVSVDLERKHFVRVSDWVTPK